jgi:hypothetical protein
MTAMKQTMHNLMCRAQYHCLRADIEHGLQHAETLGNDPFRIAVALSQLQDDRQLDEKVATARYQGLRVWLIATFMRRRQLQLLIEKQELTAFRSIFGWAPRWRFGGRC